MRSRMGRPATRSIGLGTDSVSGRSRMPRPPAMTTAGVLRDDGLQELVQQVEPDGPTRAVDDRHRRRSPGRA